MKLVSQFAWGEWIRGALAGFIGGGASAFGGGSAVSHIDPVAFPMGSTKSFKAMFWIFVFSGAYAFFAYLKQHPLPDKITTTTSETTVSRPDPQTIVTTKVQQTTESQVEHPPQP